MLVIVPSSIRRRLAYFVASMSPTGQSTRRRALVFWKSTIDPVRLAQYFGISHPGLFSCGIPDHEVIMATFTQTNPATAAMQERWARLRSHKRVISKVKLLVEWDEESAQQCANAVTVDVSHSGCMAVVGAPLPLHRRVRLVHPESGRKAEAEVVWRDHEAWDVGLELVKPDASFWGVKF